MKIEKINNKKICISGLGKLFYQNGLPLSISIPELQKKGINVSMLHIIEEFWENRWSWKTISRKLSSEMEVDKTLNFQMEDLKYFYDCLEQPKRSNGGYEESRELIFKSLFGSKKEALDWAKEKIYN